MEFVLVSNLPHVPRRCPIARLAKFPFVLFRKGSRIQNVIDRYFNELDFRPKVIMAFDNADAIKAMIEVGLGVALLPFWIVQHDLRKGLLTMIRQHERPLYSKFELLRRKSNYVPKPVAAFIELGRDYHFPGLERK
jgi:DNA-binding transcriptional LysR family regulator